MYNLWWITIALGVLVLIGIFFWIFGFCYDYGRLDGLGYFGVVVTMIAGIAFITVLLMSIINPICARNEYNTFIETQVMVEEVYNGEYTDYENAGLNNTIIEVNKWLAQAKASVKQWGNWSAYCGLDLNSLEYIKLIKGEQE